MTARYSWGWEDRSPDDGGQTYLRVQHQAYPDDVWVDVAAFDATGEPWVGGQAAVDWDRDGWQVHVNARSRQRTLDRKTRIPEAIARHQLRREPTDAEVDAVAALTRHRNVMHIQVDAVTAALAPFQEEPPMTTTATPPAEDLGTLEHVPVDAIVPAPDNLRVDVGDVTELAASIEANGVQQPLTVAGGALAAGEYLLVDGHRRLAAAKKAGRPTVPCYIRHYTEAERTEAMLVTALHREDLDPIEQARGFARLVELGWTQRQIATRMFGSDKQQGRVSKAVKLLKLPEPAQQKIVDGQLSLEAARDLADMPAESQKRVLERSSSDSRLEWEIRSEKHRLEQDRRKAKLEKWLKDEAGVRVVKSAPSSGYYIGQTDKAGAKPTGAAKEHGDLSCAAVVLQSWGAAQWYCTTKKHQPKAPKQNKLDTGRDERLEQIDKAAAARREVLKKLLDGDVGTLIQAAAAQLVHQVDGEIAASLVGLDEKADDDELVAYATTSNANALRLVCALAFGGAEEDLGQLRWHSLGDLVSDRFRYMSRADIRAHYELLIDRGYEPTDEERAGLSGGTGDDDKAAVA